MSERKRYISIWFFIGSLLLVYGVLILGAGVYDIFYPPQHLVLQELHAGVWWGMLLIVIGGVYCHFFRPGRQKQS